MFQLAMTGGFFIAAIVAALLTYIKDENLSWRLMLGLGGVPALIQLIAFSFMPESPRWLALRGREDQAYKVMVRIYGGGDLAGKHAEFELKAIKESEVQAKRDKELMGLGMWPGSTRSSEGHFSLLGDHSSLGAIVRTPHLRKALIIGCSLQMMQQLSGVNTVK